MNSIHNYGWILKQVLRIFCVDNLKILCKFEKPSRKKRQETNLDIKKDVTFSFSLLQKILNFTTNLNFNNIVLILKQRWRKVRNKP